MTDRTDLLEAGLDCLPEGFALADPEGSVAFWNRAAAAITGYPAVDVIGKPVRDTVESLIVGGFGGWTTQTNEELAPGRGSLVHVRHRLGHELRVMVRILILRDGLGGRAGVAALFHPAERLDALPHGDCSDHAGAESSQAEIEDRLEAEFSDFKESKLPFGILWINVDQAHELRRTHGVRACEAMLEKVAHVLTSGLRPGEEAGRWGDDEFLIVSHERSAEMLVSHAQTLASLARTTDFRWWGDRISLTVSAGAAQASEEETLPELLERAQSAMRASVHAGGNHVTQAQRGQPCSQS